MLKNTLVFFLAVTSCYMLISCSESLHTDAWRAPGADFKKYKAYAWVVPGDTILNGIRKDKLFAGSIEFSTNEELKKKGMVKVARQPDVVFMFDTQTKEGVLYEQGATLSVGVAVSVPSYYGGPGYYVGASAPVAGGKVTAVPFQEGTLIIEMFDTRTRQLVWRGWAQKAIRNSSDINQEIKLAVKYILYKLPVKHKI